MKRHKDSFIKRINRSLSERLTYNIHQSVIAVDLFTPMWIISPSGDHYSRLPTLPTGDASVGYSTSGTNINVHLLQRLTTNVHVYCICTIQHRQSIKTNKISKFQFVVSLLASAVAQVGFHLQSTENREWEIVKFNPFRQVWQFPSYSLTLPYHSPA